MSLDILFHRSATSFFHKIYSLFGLKVLGPRAIILNEEKEILLVKSSNEPFWFLPGGAVKRGESIKRALLRELEEEVGVIVNDEPQLFGIYYNTEDGVDDYPVIYIVQSFSLISSNSPEIEDKKWFNFHELPLSISPGTKRRLNEYFTKSVPEESW